MTILCGLNTKNGVYIGSDSRVTFGDNEYYDCFNKINSCTVDEVEITYGFSGDGKAEDLILKVLRKLKVWDVYKFATKLRDQYFIDGWVPRKDEGSPRSFSSSMLITDSFNLWAVGTACEVTVIPPNMFYSIGSGNQYALGATFAYLRNTDIQMIVDSGRVNEMFKTCIKAAINYDPNCGGTPNIVERARHEESNQF